MSEAIDYAEHYDAVVEPRNIEIERGVKSLRDGGHYGSLFNQDVVDEMADSEQYADAVLACATVNPMSPEGKKAMDAMSDLYDWAARRVVHREIERTRK